MPQMIHHNLPETLQSGAAFFDVHIVKAKDMLNPKDNLLVGIEIFSTYYATAKQDVRGALMYYSAGNKRMADKVFTLISKLEKSYNERLKNS